MEALIARQAELQDHIDASDAWNIDNKWNGRWMRFAVRLRINS